MRQVPHGNTYTLIGSGRLALHLQHLLTLKGVAFNQWSRNNNPEFNTNNQSLNSSLAQSSHLLLAISDDSLEEYIYKYKDKYTLIHFSGAYYSKDAIGAHPLMTFPKSLFKNSFYDSIPFIVDQDIPLHKVIPNLENPYHFIKPSLKPLYHCFCTMSGNFTQILWQSMLMNFKEKTGLPSSAITPFMEKTFESLKKPEQALTGPFVRGDISTINQHIKSLENTNESELYRSFLNYYINSNDDSKLEPLKRETK